VGIRGRWRVVLASLIVLGTLIGSLAPSAGAADRPPVARTKVVYPRVAPPLPVLPTTWYFAEGYTGAGFDEYLTIMNPNNDAANVEITYYLASGGPQMKSITVPARTRYTVTVHGTSEGVGRGQAVAAKVVSTNNVGIVVERPIYFTYGNGVTGGHNVMGVNSPRQTWYFAEGYTGAGFDQYLTILNPNPTPADVTITYYLTDGTTQVANLTVDATRRATVVVHDTAQGVGRDKAVSAKVTTTNGGGIVVERPMYFTYNGTITGGHNVMGAASAGLTWYFAEGYTGAGFDQYLTIMNPNTAAAQVTITYYLSSGATQQKTLTVDGNSRATVTVHGTTDGVGRNQAVAAKVASTNNVTIVVERPMYFTYGANVTGGHNVMGAAQPRTDWFFAEGYTGSGFDEYLTILNPNTSDAEVTITYYLSDGSTQEKTLTIGPTARQTVIVHDATNGVGPNQAVSARVTTTNSGGVVAERPMYFTYNGTITGGHNVMGYTPGGSGPAPDLLVKAFNTQPDAIFVGEPTTVTILATVPYDPAFGVPTVTLQRVAGNVIGTEGTLTDDGNLTTGDEIAGDGIFSLRRSFTGAAAGQILLRGLVQRGPNTTLSSTVTLDVYVRITDAQFNAIQTLQTTATQNYLNLLPSIGAKAAQAQVLAQLQQNSEVLQAGLSDSGNGIWVLYKAGFLGGLNLNPAGTKGGPATMSPAAQMQPAVAGLTQPATLATPGDCAPDAGDISASADTRIKNRKAIVFAAFLSDFGVNDDTPVIQQILRDSKCPKFDVTYLTNSQVTVDSFKTLHQYGTIAISSHGDTYYNGILSLWFDKWKWTVPGSQVVVLTRQQATTTNRKTYETDLLQGRLAFHTTSTGNYFAVLPSFIRYYNASGFQESLVYMSSCRSTLNDSMAKAFLDLGAKTYLGYSEYVNPAFAKNVGSEFFTRFVTDPAITTTGQAFKPGQKDGSTPPAFFQMRGSNDLKLPTSDLENGGFDDGKLGAWSFAGDGRVINQLGEFSPVEGAYMGIISTGLGFTTSSGSIQQSICLPSNADKLEFNWNFSSEEFIEWVGTQFQDFFVVEIITETGQTFVVFIKRIDDLAGEVNKSGLKFDRSSGNCTPTGQNDCTVWSTGWRTQSIDIAAIAAANNKKPVTIRFRVGDVGDSIFDTAVLLDRIRITTKP
jgi:hypothetical protein